MAGQDGLGAGICTGDESAFFTAPPPSDFKLLLGDFSANTAVIDQAPDRKPSNGRRPPWAASRLGADQDTHEGDGHDDDNGHRVNVLLVATMAGRRLPFALHLRPAGDLALEAFAQFAGPDEVGHFVASELV